MSYFHRLLLVCLASTVAASSCASASPQRRIEALRIHPSWEVHMVAGLDSSDLGDHEAATRHFRQAVKVARNERLAEEELAFSIYRLGDALRTRPELCRDEDALDLLDESRRHFERAYGAHHPVLMPVWVRIAAVQTERGDVEDAAASRAKADDIAARFFPERHFLRERHGAARPASMLHPLEVLRLISSEPQVEEIEDPGRVVQGSR